jgi:CBS domain-containing protein
MGEKAMKQWTVADVMTAPVVAVRANTPYGEIVGLLAENRISAVPVLDSSGRVVGVVSEADLLHKVEFIGDDTEPVFFEWGARKANRAKARGSVAKELMTSPAITVQPAMAIIAAARLMEKDNVKRLPVVDEDGRLEGIVSRNDLLKMYLRRDSEIHEDIRDGVIGRVLWIDPQLVRVEVMDGIVTLAGTVDRKSTTEIAVHLAKGVPGVVAVVDELAWEYDDTAVDVTTSL